MSSNPMKITNSKSNEKQKSICVITNGCTECRIDCAQLDHFFQESSGFQLCKNLNEADLIVFKGCAFNQEKEDLSCQIVKAIEHSRRPDAQILVTGCIAKLCPKLASNGEEFKDLANQIDRLSRFEGKKNFAANFPHPEFWQIPNDVLDPSIRSDMISKYCHRNPGASLSGIWPRLHTGFIGLFVKYRRLIDKEMLSSERTFCIKVCTGCMGNCSYCSIKLARGRIKSKPLDAIVEEFERGLDKGYEDFALLGTDIGDFGKDIARDLLDLLQKLIAHKEKFTLRLRNVNPRWLIPSAARFCELVKTGKIEYLLSPVESGSNRILDRMNRGYCVEDYVKAIRKINNAYPPIFIKTQFMVGFPGETDEDFCKSRDLFKIGLFDYAEVYAYTKRPKTKAWDLPDEVPDKIITKRYRRLLFKSLFQLPLQRWLSICLLKRKCPKVRTHCQVQAQERT